MLKKERHAIILQQLNIHNRVMSTDLLRRLKVSEDTIRRDLQELADDGMLIKVHGGAVSKNFHFTLSQNQVYQPHEKKAIAQKASELIHNDMLVLLTGGTTIRELVNVLPSELAATFVTPSLPIALELLNHPNSEVIFIGNRINKNAQMAVGAEVAMQLKGMKADLCILGVNSIEPEQGITESVWELAEVKRLMAEAATQLAAVTISEKLGTSNALPVCRCSEVDYLVTELDPTDERLAPYRLQGVRIL